MEQPEALRRAISPRIKDGRVIFDDLKLPVEKMREFTRIFIVACGSSYHVGMIGKYNLEHLLRRNVEVVLASEFRYSDPIVPVAALLAGLEPAARGGVRPGPLWPWQSGSEDLPW